MVSQPMLVIMVSLVKMISTVCGTIQSKVCLPDSDIQATTIRFIRWCCRYSRNVDDNMITRGARLDEAMERLTNWNIIMKTIKVFYRVRSRVDQEPHYQYQLAGFFTLLVLLVLLHTPLGQLPQWVCSWQSTNKLVPMPTVLSKQPVLMLLHSLNPNASTSERALAVKLQTKLYNFMKCC